MKTLKQVLNDAMAFLSLVTPIRVHCPNEKCMGMFEASLDDSDGHTCVKVMYYPETDDGDVFALSLLDEEKNINMLADYGVDLYSTNWEIWKNDKVLIEKKLEDLVLRVMH